MVTGEQYAVTIGGSFPLTLCADKWGWAQPLVSKELEMDWEPHG